MPFGPKGYNKPFFTNPLFWSGPDFLRSLILIITKVKQGGEAGLKSKLKVLQNGTSSCSILP